MANRDQLRLDTSGRIFEFTVTVTTAGTPVVVTTLSGRKFLVIGQAVTSSGTGVFKQFFDTASVFQSGTIKIDASANSTVGSVFCQEVLP